MDFRTSYQIVRQTRQMLGDERILFRHCTSDPLREVRLPRTEIGYELGLAWEPNDGHLEFFDRDYYGELERRRTRLGK